MSDAEDGSATVAMIGVTAVVSVILLVVVLDGAAYLTAAARAQTAADAAALAAVTASHPRGGASGSPAGQATAIASANGAEVERCACPRGARVVTVEVSVPVPALVITRYAARRVSASAQARMVPP